MAARRIESYVHSDSTTQNKGGSLIELCCATDFAARTPEFVEFAKQVAKHVYGAQATTWAAVAEVFPHMENRRLELSASLKEEVYLGSVAILPFTEPDTSGATEQSLPGGRIAIDAALPEVRHPPVPTKL